MSKAKRLKPEDTRVQHKRKLGRKDTPIPRAIERDAERALSTTHTRVYGRKRSHDLGVKR